MDTLIARKEVRIRSRGIVTILPASHPPADATLWDVSPSGIAVDTNEAVPPESQVDIETDTYTAAGIVRHCTPQGHGFRLGIELIPVE